MRFVLIHGGYHGAWCWDRLTPELEELGHQALAIDLPGCNERVEEPASLKSWRGALRDVVRTATCSSGTRWAASPSRWVPTRSPTRSDG